MKAENDTLNENIENFKRIASESEKRMNKTMESSTKISMLKEQEIKDLMARIKTSTAKISELESQILKLKTSEGSADITQLHAKLSNFENETKVRFFDVILSTFCLIFHAI